MPIVPSDSSGNPEAEKPATAGSDEQLMVAFSGLSAKAFTELFSRYKQPLFGFFRRRVADPAQQELTQETFLAVLRAWLRYAPCTNLSLRGRLQDSASASPESGLSHHVLGCGRCVSRTCRAEHRGRRAFSPAVLCGLRPHPIALAGHPCFAAHFRAAEIPEGAR
jgi:hypothetical protein